MNALLDGLRQSLHTLSSWLLLPTIAGLLGLLAFSVAELGSLFSEWVRERRQVRAGISHLLLRLGGGAAEAGEVLENSALSPRQKRALRELAGQASLSPPELRALARWLLSREEEHYAKVVNRTDMVARLGPMLGLMGTLIPLGPGLMALGQGNMEKLAASLLIAFDTTVVGLAAGGIAFVISRIRKRWYEEDLGALEALMEALLEVLSGERRAEEEKTLVGRQGRGQSVGGRP
jgi:biopolymer transport protein ExbB/TolQ